MSPTPQCPIILEEGKCTTCFQPTYRIKYDFGTAWFHKYVEHDYDHCPTQEPVSQ